MGRKEQKIHIGEKFINSQGFEYEIIEWIRWNNVTVRFFDGVKKTGCQYENIKSGVCPHPILSKIKPHIGEKFINNQGFEYEVVDWINSRNVTVKFADGVIKEGCQYDRLQRGACPHPILSKIKPHIGEKFINNQGFEYEVVDWINSRNLTVKFADGVIKEGCQYGAIAKGQCPHPTIKPHIGEKYINKDGFEYEIIDWEKSTNITVRFSDGTIKKGCTYSVVRKGQCPHPTYKPHIGEKYINKQGLEHEIIDYNGFCNITVKFSDGTIKEGCNYKNIQDGCCSHPLLSQIKPHIGEKYVNNQGIEFEIIDYIKSSDVTVRFLDGYIKKHCSYTSIKKKMCPHPVINPHIGETYTNTQGIQFKIIDWKGGRNVTVKFEDGVIREKCNYESIRKRQCSHPTYIVDSYMGKTYMNYNGVEFKIIEYEDYRNITVQFSDGEIKRGCRMGAIKRKYCPHPTFIPNKHLEYAGFVTESRAFQKNGNSYYPCICQKCEYKDILTPQEMVNHRDICKG